MKNLFFTAVFSISVSMLSAQQIESQNLQKVSSTENKLSSLNDQSSASKKLFGNVSYYYENGKLKEHGYDMMKMAISLQKAIIITG
jgi:hypothetical protein